MSSREDWEIEQEKRKMIQDQMVTEMKKNKFIEEIKSGLGECMMNEPNKVVKKLTFWQKIKKMFSNG